MVDDRDLDPALAPDPSSSPWSSPPPLPDKTEPVDGRDLDPASATDPPSFPQSSSPPLFSLPNKREREGYYYGLESQPPLLARSSATAWTLPPGPYNRPKPKQLKNVGSHKVVDMWDGDVAAEVLDVLEAYFVQWTSVEIFRIGHEGEKDMPIILWIGVRPGTLTDEHGASLPTAGKVAMACKQLLEKHNIYDIDCEIKESEAYRGALVKPSIYSSPAVDIEVFFTPTIGTCIGTKDLSTEGTHGFYVTFPEHPDKVYGVTCRHVLLPSTLNTAYRHENQSQPRRSVILPGDKFLDILRSRAVEGGGIQKTIVDERKRCLDRKSTRLNSSHYGLSRMPSSA